MLASFLCCLVITLSMCLLCLCVYFIFCVSFALRLFLLFEIALCFNIFVSQYSCVLTSLCFNIFCFNILVFLVFSFSLACVAVKEFKCLFVVIYSCLCQVSLICESALSLSLCLLCLCDALSLFTLHSTTMILPLLSTQTPRGC